MTKQKKMIAVDSEVFKALHLMKIEHELRSVNEVLKKIVLKKN